MFQSSRFLDSNHRYAKRLTPRRCKLAKEARRASVPSTVINEDVSLSKAGRVRRTSYLDRRNSSDLSADEEVRIAGERTTGGKAELPLEGHAHDRLVVEMSPREGKHDNQRKRERGQQMKCISSGWRVHSSVGRPEDFLGFGDPTAPGSSAARSATPWRHNPDCVGGNQASGGCLGGLISISRRFATDREDVQPLLRSARRAPP